jgi:molybdopterin-binding protein
MSRDLSLGEAAKAIGISTDTLRRWDRAGKISTHRDERNRRLVPESEVRRLTSAPQRHRTSTGGSARNRFTGTVRSVEIGGLITAAITRDSVQELGLAPGVETTAVVKATSVMIERTAPEQRQKA